MDRSDLCDMWERWWRGDIWVASWQEGLAGISPKQALWSPQDGAHCIWQLVRHVTFWREVTVGYLRGEGRPSAERLEEQFSCPAEPDSEEWEALKADLRDSHDTILDLLSDSSQPDDRVRYHLVHDAYHFGQIMYLRRMLGFDVVTPS